MHEPRKIVCALALAGLTLLTGCEAFDSDLRVRYEIEGTGDEILVTYRTESGFDSSRVVQPPFAYEGDYLEGSSLGIAAQSLDDGSQIVLCRVLVEGDEIDDDAEQGIGAQVICSGVALK